MTIIQGSLASLLVDLESAVTKVIEEHCDRDDSLVGNYGYFEVSVKTVDGLVARFFEEGIDIYPKEEK